MPLGIQELIPVDQMIEMVAVLFHYEAEIDLKKKGHQPLCVKKYIRSKARPK